MFVIALLLIGCGQKSIQELKDEAQTSIANNKYDLAILSLKNALVQDRNDRGIRIMLGDAYMGVGDYTSAQKEYSRVLTNSNNDEDENKVLRGRLAQAYFLQNDINEVFQIYRESINNDNALSNELLFFTSLAYQRVDETAVSLLLLEEVNSSSDKDSFSVIATIYKRLFTEKMPTQNDVSEELIRGNVSQFFVEWVLADLFLRTEQIDLATSKLIAASEMRPKDLMLKVVLTDSLIRQGKVSQGMVVATELQQKLPNNPLVHQLIGTILLAEQNYELAAQKLELAIQGGLTSASNYMLAGIANFSIEKYESSMANFEKALAQSPDNKELQRLYITNSFLIGSVDNALALLSSIDSSDESFFDLYVNAAFSLNRMGMQNKSDEVRKKVNQLDKVSVDQDLMRNILNLSMGDSSAIIAIKDVVKKNKLNGSLKLSQLVRLFSQQDMHAEAIELARSILTENANSVEALNLLAGAFFSSGDTESANDYYLKAQVIDPNNIPTLLFLANQSTSLEKESKFLFNAYQVSPYSEDVMSKLLGLILKGFPASKVLLKTQEVAPTTDAEKVFHASHQAYIKLMGNDYIGALDMLSTVSASNDQKSALFWYVKGEAEYSTLDFRNAYASYVELSQFRDARKVAMFKRIFTLEANGFYEKAIEDAELSANSFKNDVRFQLIKIQLLLTNKQIELAEREFKNLPSELLGKNIVYQQLEGRLLAARGQLSAATPKLVAAYDANPDTVSAMYVYGLFRASRDRDGAIKFLEKHLATYPNHLSLKLVLADIYLSTDIDKAEMEYKSIVEKGGKSSLIFNNLAWVLMSKDELSEAEVYIEKAIELTPNDANVLETAGDIMAAQGNTEEAVGLYYRALQIAPTSELRKKVGL